MKTYHHYCLKIHISLHLLQLAYLLLLFATVFLSDTLASWRQIVANIIKIWTLNSLCVVNVNLVITGFLPFFRYSIWLLRVFFPFINKFCPLTTARTNYEWFQIYIPRAFFHQNFRSTFFSLLPHQNSVNKWTREWLNPEI